MRRPWPELRLRNKAEWPKVLLEKFPPDKLLPKRLQLELLQRPSLKLRLHRFQPSPDRIHHLLPLATDTWEASTSLP